MAVRKRVPKPHEILSKFLERKQKRQPAYSLRAFARDIGFSAAYASQMMKGKKTVAVDRLERLIQILDIDEVGQDQLRKSLLYSSMEKSAVGKIAFEHGEFQAPSTGDGWDFKELDFTKFPMLEQWHHLAVLNLATCRGFDPAPARIAERLGISTEQALSSIRLLLSLGVLSETDGGYRMSQEKLRFPTKTSDTRVRHHHRQMIQRAQNLLMSQASQSQFERRLITSVTFACDPSRLKEAKARIEKVMFEVAQDLSDGDCTEVYQYNVQFFPLTREKARK